MNGNDKWKYATLIFVLNSILIPIKRNKKRNTNQFDEMTKWMNKHNKKLINKWKERGKAKKKLAIYFIWISEKKTQFLDDEIEQ